MEQKAIVLTGDRPTGPLHLGHYIGSLKTRKELEGLYDQYIMIADMQALTDNAGRPQKVIDSLFQVALDYLAVGLDPEKNTFFVQSAIPAIAEMAIVYLNLVTVNRLKRNPTVKTEIHQRGFEGQIPAGFLMYPVHQAADITCVKGTIIPVGEDQLPIIEQANEIIRSFNRTYKPIFSEVKPLLTKVSRLMGIDGKNKMSKSLHNAIFLSDDADTVKKQVMRMYTDPDHIKVEDPGKIEGNVVFMYLDAFATDKQYVHELKQRYQAGGVADVMVKRYLVDVLNAFLEPIRMKRTSFEQDKAYVMGLLQKGSEKACERANQTYQEMKQVMGISYW